MIFLLLFLFSFQANAQVGSTSTACIWSGSVADCLPASGLLLRDQRDLRLGEATANGSNYVALQSPATLAGDVTLTLPADDGDADEVLGTNGSGTLDWTLINNANVGASAAIAGSKIVSATASVAGVVTTGTQAFAGDKTFNGTANVIGNSAHTGSNETGGQQKIIGVISPGIVENTDAGGALSIYANSYGSASFPYRTQTSPGGVALRLLPRTSNTGGAFIFQANKASDSTTTAAAVIGFADQNGSWTFGPTAYGGRHSLNVGSAGTATAGTNGAPPAQVSGYIEVIINGTNRKIAYYND